MQNCTEITYDIQPTGFAVSVRIPVKNLLLCLRWDRLREYRINRMKHILTKLKFLNDNGGTDKRENWPLAEQWFVRIVLIRICIGLVGNLRERITKLRFNIITFTNNHTKNVEKLGPQKNTHYFFNFIDQSDELMNLHAMEKTGITAL